MVTKLGSIKRDSSLLFFSFLFANAAPAIADDVFSAPKLKGEIENKIGVKETSADSDPNALIVEGVTVEGNRIVPTEQILNVVKTRNGDKFDREQIAQDLKAINELGFFDDKNLQVTPELSSTGVLLKIRVQENAPVTDFSFGGNTIVKSEELAKLFANQLGKPQNLAQLSGTIDKIEQSYHEKGFTLARVVDVKDDPDGCVHLRIDEGVINSIQIVGNKKTKDFFIRAAIKSKPGSVYNEKQITADLRKLYSDGYFQDIKRSLTPSSSDQEKYDLKVEVVERNSQSASIGGGVDMRTGLSLNLSASDANFLGRGRYLGVKSQTGSGILNSFAGNLANGGTGFVPSARSYQIEGHYIDPHFRGTDTALSVNPFVRNTGSMIFDNSMQRAIGNSVSFNRKLNEKWDANFGFSGQNVALKSMDALTNQSAIVQRVVQLNKANQENALAYANDFRNKALTGGNFINVTPSLTRDTRDQLLNPHTGSRVQVAAGPTFDFSSASGFAKLSGNAAKYVPLGKDKTLALSVRGGTALGQMPQLANFAIGGFNGVRGYTPFSSLGNGSSMLMSSAEIRMAFPLPKSNANSRLGAVTNIIRDKAGLFTYFDVGAVGGNSLYNQLYARSNFGASAGLGLRVQLPYVGLVKISGGMPLVAPLSGGKLIPRFNVGFGD